MRRSTEALQIVLLTAAFAFIGLSLAPCGYAGAQMPGQKMPGLVPIQVEQTSHGIKATAGKEVLEATVCGTTSGPANHSLAVMRSRPKRHSITCRAMATPWRRPSTR